MATRSTSRSPAELPHYLDDPYVDRTDRPALHDDVTVAIIGGGFAGLIAGARLRQAGIDDVRIIEKGGDFGGTWYWNRYPGRPVRRRVLRLPPACSRRRRTSRRRSTPTHPRSSSTVAASPSTSACTTAPASPTEVTGIEWDAARVSAGRSAPIGATRMSARFLVMGNGPLHRPKLPGHPGYRDVRRSHVPHQPLGLRLHRRRLERGPRGLRDKRVGIIGTGATAVQVVPHVAEAATQLYVFQRTPSSIDVRANRPTDPAWAAALAPGWQRERIENFTLLTSGGIADRTWSWTAGPTSSASS